MNLAFARELYYREQDAKAEQDRRIGVFVALLSALGAVLLFLIRTAWPPRDWASAASVALILVAAALYCLGVARVLCATVGHTYRKIAPPLQLLAWSDQLHAYHRDYPESEGSAGDDFEAGLIERLLAAADWNANTNQTRSERFYEAARFLVWVVVFSALAWLPIAVAAVLRLIWG